MLGRKNQVTENRVDSINIEIKKPIENVRLVTTIANDSHFEGVLKINGDIKIWGTVKGNLFVNNGVAQVMKGGKVDGEIEAEHVIINGKVEGKCRTINLEIQDQGELSGTCSCENISISKGGKFLGHSEFLDDKVKKQLLGKKENNEAKGEKTEKKNKSVEEI